MRNVSSKVAKISCGKLHLGELKFQQHPCFARKRVIISNGLFDTCLGFLLGLFLAVMNRTISLYEKTNEDRVNKCHKTKWKKKTKLTSETKTQ